MLCQPKLDQPCDYHSNSMDPSTYHALQSQAAAIDKSSVIVLKQAVVSELVA